MDSFYLSKFSKQSSEKGWKEKPSMCLNNISFFCFYFLDLGPEGRTPNFWDREIGNQFECWEYDYSISILLIRSEIFRLTRRKNNINQLSFFLFRKSRTSLFCKSFNSSNMRRKVGQKLENFHILRLHKTHYI